uniref:NeuD/PglB/VioB family sugar acetyltransferase n=1 Tax=Falsiroseomonas oryzae TaxID=2766473 RepID=UPI0022EA15F9
MMRVAVLGAGGHAKPVIETLRAMGAEVAGVLDDAPRGTVLGAPQLGTLADLARLREDGIGHAAIAIGHNATRAALGEACTRIGLALPAVIHPAALVSPSARIGAGAQVMARAVIGPEAVLGALVLVNSGAIVEHDCRLDEAAHVGPGAVLCGFVQVGARALVGAGAVARPSVSVGADAVVAPGAAVAEDVPQG